jgi:hypothetical protein
MKGSEGGSVMVKYGFQAFTILAGEALNIFIKHYPEKTEYVPLIMMVINIIICIERRIEEEPTIYAYPPR